MPTYTVLKREHLIRAEQDAEVIQQLTLCGYVNVGPMEADNADQAVAKFREANPEKKAKKALGLRWMMGVGGVFAVVWFIYLIFFLLPIAFQD